jgi:hypothetical protein
VSILFRFTYYRLSFWPCSDYCIDVSSKMRLRVMEAFGSWDFFKSTDSCLCRSLFDRLVCELIIWRRHGCLSEHTDTSFADFLLEAPEWDRLLSLFYTLPRNELSLSDFYELEDRISISALTMDGLLDLKGPTGIYNSSGTSSTCGIEPVLEF